jgi:peptide/nickel transport system ATP-binding protein
VQAQILNLLADLRRRLGLGYLFVTHDLAVVRQVTDRIYVLYRGAVVEAGATEDVLSHPQHDYTRALIESVPQSHPTWLAPAPLPAAS